MNAKKASGKKHGKTRITLRLIKHTSSAQEPQKIGEVCLLLDGAKKEDTRSVTSTRFVFAFGKNYFFVTQTKTQLVLAPAG